LNFFNQKLIVRVSASKYFFPYFTDTAPLYFIYSFFFFVCVGSAFTLQILSLRRSDINQTKRLQYIYMLLATTFGFFGGSTAFLPVFGVNIYPFGMYFVVLYPMLMTYAIVKHKLLDIEVII
jgi:hypothetical protein